MKLLCLAFDSSLESYWDLPGDSALEWPKSPSRCGSIWFRRPSSSTGCFRWEIRSEILEIISMLSWEILVGFNFCWEFMSEITVNSSLMN